MADGDVKSDRYQRGLDALGRSEFGGGLNRRSAAIFVWSALDGGGTFERVNAGFSSMFGIASGVIGEGLFDLRAAGLARLATRWITSGGDTPDVIARIGHAPRTPIESIDQVALTRVGERTARVVRSA